MLAGSNLKIILTSRIWSVDLLICTKLYWSYSLKICLVLWTRYSFPPLTTKYKGKVAGFNDNKTILQRSTRIVKWSVKGWIYVGMSECTGSECDKELFDTSIALQDVSIGCGKCIYLRTDCSLFGRDLSDNYIQWWAENMFKCRFIPRLSIPVLST